MRALVVEDEPRLCETLARGLREEGTAVDAVGTVREADELWTVNPYDYVVLDLSLPDGDGLDLLASMRERGLATPVLVLTARDAVGARVKGLDAGADDYLVKPFAFQELLARCRALARRGPQSTPPTLARGDVTISIASHAAHVSGLAVSLTAKEFALLLALLKRSPRYVSKAELLEACWENAYDGVSNVIEVHVASVRRKLRAGGSKAEIRALRNVGYRFEASS